MVGREGEVLRNGGCSHSDGDWKEVLTEVGPLPLLKASTSAPPRRDNNTTHHNLNFFLSTPTHQRQCGAANAPPVSRQLRNAVAAALHRAMLLLLSCVGCPALRCCC